MTKLLQRKEPVVVFQEEDMLTSTDWLRLISVYKNKKYTILYRGEEYIYINPAVENSKEISEIIPALFRQKYLNKKSERPFDEIEKLIDKETTEYLQAILAKWRKKVKKLELHNQAESILKQARSKRLYYKTKKNEEIIEELFDIGYGLYDKEAKADYQKGAENTFMYGYLLGMENHSSCISERGKDAL